MAQSESSYDFPVVGDGSGLSSDPNVSFEELQLALRNRGMPLEALRYPITPTGLHYLLTHFDIPYGDEGDWRLSVDGLVKNPLSLSMMDIKSRPSVKVLVTMECAGNGRALMAPRPISQPWLYDGIGNAEWTGTPLKGVLEEAGIADGAVEILFTGRDRGVQGDEAQDYQRSLTIEDAMRDEVMLVYEMNGAPLEPQHGYPLRLIVPGWYGMTSVKWLDRIEVIAEPFKGYQMEAYQYLDAPDETGEPVNLIRVRSLMIPPGIPDFLTRTRVAEAGRIEITGRAWAGRLDVTRVEVSTDGGETWADGSLGERLSEYSWRGWSFEWDAKPGKHTLCVRATDSEENVQPIDQPWNFYGMGNNMVHRVAVIVQ